MTTGPETILAGNTGPVHGGEGTQINGPVFVGAEWLLCGGRDQRRTAREYLTTLNRQFVEPPGYATAQLQLTTRGCAILVGRPGIGMRAAGQVLLRRLGGPDAVVHDESGLPDGPGEQTLDTARVAAGDLVLLDTSDAEGGDLLRIAGRLPSYYAELRDLGAHLVVVLAEDRQQIVDDELRPMLVPLRRPDALDVVRRHLEIADIPFVEDELRSNSALRSRLAVDPMRNLAELVRLVGGARDQRGGAGDFREWLAAALDVLGELGDRVTAQVRAKRRGAQRALLLAAGMLVGAPADQVAAAAAELAAVTLQPGDERPELERDDLAERLAELKITVDENGQVGFPTFGYDSAVRQHFWSNFPELRPRFREWADRMVRLPGVGANHLDDFLGRYCEQALRTDQPDSVAKLVEGWVGLADARSLHAAGIVLERGLGDWRHAARLRRSIYTVSRAPGLNPGAAQLMVALCAKVVAPTHPDEALVRLHHLVRRQSGYVQAAARDALLGVARQSQREFRLLLDRVVTGMLAEHPRPADFELFRTVARPAEPALVSGLADPFVRDRLLAGWRAELAGRPKATWAALAAEWLEAAAIDGLPDRWLDTLAQAGAKPGIGAGPLYAVARDWAQEPDAGQARYRIALDLVNRMDRAQEGPPAAGPRHRSEEPIR